MSVSLYPLRHVRHFGTSDKTQRLSSTTRIIRRGHGFLHLQPLIERGFTVLTHSLAIYGLYQQCGQVQGRKSRTKRVQGSSMPKEGTAALRERRKSMGYEA